MSEARSLSPCTAPHPALIILLCLQSLEQMVHLQLEVKSPASRLRMDNLSPTPEEQASVLLSYIGKLGDAMASPILPITGVS